MGQESLAPKETKCKTQNSRKTRQKQPERPCIGKQLTAGVGEASQHPRPPSRRFLSKKSSKSKNPAKKLRRPEKSLAAGKMADGGPGAAETSDEANPPNIANQNPQTDRRSEKSKLRRRRALAGRKPELMTAHRRLPETRDSGSLRRTSDDHR